MQCSAAAMKTMPLPCVLPWHRARAVVDDRRHGRGQAGAREQRLRGGEGRRELERSEGVYIKAGHILGKGIWLLSGGIILFQGGGSPSLF